MSQQEAPPPHHPEDLPGAPTPAVLGWLDRLDRALLALWRNFKSIKFGLFLLAVIGAVSIYGTMFYAANNTLGEQAIPLAKGRVFNANWFFALLALFAFQFVVSTWHVTKMSVSLWWKRDFSAGKAFFEHGHGRGVLRVEGGVDAVEPRLRGLFTRVHREGDRFFAHAGLRQRMGPTIIHAGIIIILAAGLVRIVMDRRGEILSDGRFIGVEGETMASFLKPIHNDQLVGPGNITEQAMPFDVTVLDFDVILHPNSDSPAYFSSLLEVRDHATGRTSVAKLDMNHSYRIGDWEFHQAGYQPIPPVESQRFDFDVWDARVGERIAVTDGEPGVRVQVGDEDLFLETEGTTPGSAWRLFRSTDPRTPVATGPLLPSVADHTFAFMIEEVFPDLRINEQGRPYNASNDPNNPALRVRVVRDNIPSDSTAWVFLDPEFAAATPPPDPRFRLVLEDIQVAGSVDNIDWTDSQSVRYIIGVQDTESGESVSRQPVFLGTTSEPVAFRGSGSDELAALPADADFAVFARGPSTRYMTILMVVNEPVVPYYVGGVVLMFLGAMLTFTGRYRAFHGRWDAGTGTLRYALVPRFGRKPDPRDEAALVAAFGGKPEFVDEAPGEVELETAGAGV